MAFITMDDLNGISTEPPTEWGGNPLEKRKTANQELIEKFNTMFPVGSTVSWRFHKSQQFKKYTVRCAAYDNHGTPVTFLNGHRGMVSIEPDFVDYK